MENKTYEEKRNSERVKDMDILFSMLRKAELNNGKLTLVLQMYKDELINQQAKMLTLSKVL